jgi:hypothetical protein
MINKRSKDDEHRDICLDIERRYELKFLEIGTDKRACAFFSAGGPDL